MFAYFRVIVCVAAFGLVTACGGDDPGGGPGAAAQFDPIGGELPFPNAAIFDPSANRVAFPDPSGELSDPQTAYNTRDGFSTVAPSWVEFTEPIDPASVGADAVRVFRVSDPFTTEVSGDTTGAVPSEGSELVYGEDFFADVSSIDSSRLYVTPKRPLDPQSNYLVVITDSLRDLAGRPVQASDTYDLLSDPGTEDAGGLAGLQQLILNYEGFLADDRGIPREDIAVSYHFPTQSVIAALEEIDASASAQTVTSASMVGSTDQFGGRGSADVYKGRIELPYFLAEPQPASGTRGPNNLVVEDVSAFTTPWDQSAPGAAPSERSTVEAPFILTVPQGTPPTGGWPVTLFYHGLTGNRTNVFAIADSLAEAGLATIAIDQPLHGLSPQSALWDVFGEPAHERHFFTDYEANGAPALGEGDGEFDGSGAIFNNLVFPLTSRDNSRQAAADLIHVAASVGNISSAAGLTSNLLNPNQLRYTGISLGGISGATFLGADMDATVTAASLAVPSAGRGKLLDGAPAFQQAFREGLRSGGLSAGTLDYESFLVLSQGLGDPGDPVNYARSAGANHPIHVMEVIGTPGNPDRPPDLVVPNQVVRDGDELFFGSRDMFWAYENFLDGEVFRGAPLTGTEPLAETMGLSGVSATTQESGGLRALVRFTDGKHGSQLDPTPLDGRSAERFGQITAEMQAQTAGFLASDGTQLPINDDASDPFIK